MEITQFEPVLKGPLIEKPRLKNGLRFEFTITDEADGKMVACESTVFDNAEEMVKEMQTWKRVALDGDFLSTDKPVKFFKVKAIRNDSTQKN